MTAPRALRPRLLRALEPVPRGRSPASSPASSTRRWPRRLAEGGVFLQWVQAYEVDERTIATILATLATVFPEVEVWQIHRRRPAAGGVAAARCATTPPRLARAHRAGSRSRARCARLARDRRARGVLARFVAGPAAGAPAAGARARPSTPTTATASSSRSRAWSRRPRPSRWSACVPRPPPWARTGPPSPERSTGTGWRDIASRSTRSRTIRRRWSPRHPPATATRGRAQGLYVRGRLAEALDVFRAQPGPPSGLVETALFAEGLAERGDADAASYIRALGARRSGGSGRGGGAARLSPRKARSGGGGARVRVPALPCRSLAEPGRDGARRSGWRARWSRPTPRRRPVCTKRCPLLSPSARSSRSGVSPACSSRDRAASGRSAARRWPPSSPTSPGGGISCVRVRSATSGAETRARPGPRPTSRNSSPPSRGNIRPPRAPLPAAGSGKAPGETAPEASQGRGPRRWLPVG